MLKGYSSASQRALCARPARQRANVCTRAERGPASSLHARRESDTAALERRLQESKAVEERVKDIESPAELEEHLKQAGDRLVILEVSEKLSAELTFVRRGGHGLLA